VLSDSLGPDGEVLSGEDFSRLAAVASRCPRLPVRYVRRHGAHAPPARRRPARQLRAVPPRLASRV